MTGSSMPPARRADNRPLKLLAVLLAAGGGLLLAPALGTSSAALPTSTGLWPATTTPEVAAAADTAPVELGTRLSPAKAGIITGLRIYRGANLPGSYAGSLWSADGRRLATAATNTGTAAGWKTIVFPKPVPVTAGSTYTASYYAPGGRYSTDQGYFSAGPYTRAPLKAMQGVYKYGTSGFPTSTWLGSNYWVDVLFSATPAAPAPPTPPPSGPTPFPTASTTGPTGALTTYAGSLNACGTVSGRDITGDLVLTCDTTLTNSRVRGRITDNGHRLVATDSTIGPDSCPSRPGPYAGINSGDFSLTRVHVQYAEADLIQVGGGGSVSITDSLIDNACYYPADHLDAVQFYDPGTRADITLRHNRIDTRAKNNSSLGNGALFFADNPGRGSVFTIADNLLAGGNYTTAFYDAYRGSGVTYRVTGNTYARGTSQYGPCITNSAAFDGADGLVFTGNVHSDGSALSSC